MKKDLSVIIMVVVIAAVAVLGGFAVAPTIKSNMDRKHMQEISERMMNGTATVEDYAEASGMTAEETLAQYGLTTEDATKDTNIMELAEKMTLENFCKFMGLTYTDEDLEAYKAENEDAKDLTKDTKDAELKNAFAQYLSAKQSAEQAPAAEEAAVEETTTEETTEETVEESAE